MLRRVLGVFALSAVYVSAQDKAIDTVRSAITIHTGKAGLFSAAGHEHSIDAPIASGSINEADPPHVEFHVDAARMEVRPDPKIDAKTQAEIQRDMQQMTLESSRYPEIVFRSTRIVKQSGEQWNVEGMLTLHGVSKAVSAIVKRDQDVYSGRAVIKQTDFGIKPIVAGGGLIKVKNELEIDFRILTK